MSLDGQDLDTVVHVENICLLEMKNGPRRKDGFEGIHKIAHHWKSRLQITWSVMELIDKIDSTQDDGTLPWIVISSGLDKYVTELPEVNTTPIHFEEVATSTGQLVAMRQKEQILPSLSSSSSTIVPINKW